VTDLLQPLERAAIIRLGGAINHRCVGSAGGSTPERTVDAILGDMEQARADGAERVVLVGGEPTLRKDLGQVLEAAAGLDLRPGLATNGRMLAYSRVRRRLRAAGVDYLRFSLHGPTAREHDVLVGVGGAFAQSMSALKAWLVESPGTARVDVACTVTATNVELLAALMELLAALPRRARLGLRLVAPLAGLPSGKTADLDAVRRHVGALLSGTSPLPLAWEGFPDCALADHLDHRLEDLRRQLPAHGPVEDGGAVPREEPGDLMHPEPCRRCTLRDRCAGAPAWLLRGEGEGALRPRGANAPLANSFNFELVCDLPGFSVDPAGCPARDLELGGVPARHLLLQLEQRAGLYRTPTRDFSNAVIRRVVEGTEQLYLDTCPGAALGELARHVLRVRMHPGCLGCDFRSRCCGAVVVQPGDPFEPQERWLKAQLQTMRGKVLDVGCGEQPYREQIAALAEFDQVDYHGLDPDRRALDAVAGSGLIGTLHHGRIEDFSGQVGTFHWVLALRTLNHVEDLERALEVICAALRPGGRLLLSDMTVYGLLRTPDQVAAADARGRGDQQHFRNWDSQEVLLACRRHPLNLLEHQPVTRETSNEWFLLLERRP